MALTGQFKHDLSPLTLGGVDRKVHMVNPYELKPVVFLCKHGAAGFVPLTCFSEVHLLFHFLNRSLCSTSVFLNKYDRVLLHHHDRRLEIE